MAMLDALPIFLSNVGRFNGFVGKQQSTNKSLQAALRS
jgi:hypothetical protein